MAALSCNRLLEQAERLAKPPCDAEPPGQTDLRRAVSNAYYAMFHCVLMGPADQFVGKDKRGTPLYALVYRQPDHARLKALCKEVLKSPLPESVARFTLAGLTPAGGLKEYIPKFAHIFVDLHEKREKADYDPSLTLVLSEVIQHIKNAREAVSLFRRASPSGRAVFLTLALCKPR